MSCNGIKPSIVKDKFQPRGVPCVFIGYPSDHKGYRLFNLLTSKTLVSRDVKFHENIHPYHIIQTTSSQPKPNNNTDLTKTSPIAYEEEEPELEQDLPSSQPSPQPVLRQSTRHHKTPAWHSDYHISTLASSMKPKPNQIHKISETVTSPKFFCFMTKLSEEHDPTHFRDAVKHPKWKQAMDDELEALESNNTWEMCDLPNGKNPIGCKWLYRTKYNPDGTIERAKARLVVLGNRQKYGTDYLETFAPVAKMATVRSLLAVAAIQEWNVHQMDVKNAFLHGDLEETVYMKPPPGYIKAGFRFCKDHNDDTHHANTGQVCKLLKSLYGIKQAPRQWFAKLKTALTSHNFNQSKTDYSLFTKHDALGFVAILIYVDDLIITGDNMNAITSAKQVLSSQFHMKDMGELRYFL